MDVEAPIEYPLGIECVDLVLLGKTSLQDGVEKCNAL